MTNIIIFANGLIENPRAEAAHWIQPDDVIVAADGGTRHALAAGLTPTHVIGDMDSLEPELRARLKATGTTFHVHPPAKDETDLELALLWAAEQAADAVDGVNGIIILGALGGRPDQELANLLLLALPALAGHEVVLAGGGWAIRVIRSGETLTLRGAPGATVSLIPLGGDAHGVTTTGLAYPLRDESLHFGPARGVSNVTQSEEAAVTVREGLVWCLHEVKHHASNVKNNGNNFDVSRLTKQGE